MKKLITLIILISITIVLLSAFKGHESKDMAKVNHIEGLFIFTDATPVLEYEYLGTVKSSFTIRESEYTVVRDKLIKKAKKEFPQADGIIFNFKPGETDKADVIKFK